MAEVSSGLRPAPNMGSSISRMSFSTLGPTARANMLMHVNTERSVEANFVARLHHDNTKRTLVRTGKGTSHHGLSMCTTRYCQLMKYLTMIHYWLVCAYVLTDLIISFQTTVKIFAELSGIG